MKIINPSNLKRNIIGIGGGGGAEMAEMTAKMAIRLRIIGEMQWRRNGESMAIWYQKAAWRK
jgi:hypothetical protein